MNLVILHYHLNRGGVTRVIENQLTALDAVLDRGDPWRVALLHGGRREGWSEDLPERLQSIRLSLGVAPLLDYDDVQAEGQRHSPDDLHRQLTAVLEQLGFAPPQTIVHVHNHSLGKNRHIPRMVATLAEDGYAMLLQIHDFAEDFRAGNYARTGAAAALYPQAEGIHYAVLNGRDRDVLQQAGVEPRRLHLLPNAIPAHSVGHAACPTDGMAHLPSRADARARLQEHFGVGPEDCLVLYPVRCIRRKNVGEALLYGALAPKGTVVGLTLPPLNPAELPIYTMWKELAAELQLPCRFELGVPGALSFAENLAAADVILTTSLAEGFGMVFLESWLAGRPLVGRDLPEISTDFSRAGLRFDWLRSRLQVPLSWVGAERFHRTLREAFRRTLAAYHRLPPQHLAEDLAAKSRGGLVDFGDLDEPMQQQVIRTVRREPRNRREVLRLNPRLKEAFAVRADTAAEVIEHNAAAIHRHYSVRPSGRRLLELYRQVAASPRDAPPRPLADGEPILDRFLTLPRFRLIRS